jgi:hypothetical protein
MAGCLILRLRCRGHQCLASGISPTKLRRATDRLDPTKTSAQYTQYTRPCAMLWLLLCRWHQIYQVAEPLHGAKRASTHERIGTDHTTQEASADAPVSPGIFDDIHPVVNPTPPKIALLIHAENGAVRSSQANFQQLSPGISADCMQ